MTTAESLLSLKERPKVNTELSCTGTEKKPEHLIQVDLQRSRNQKKQRADSIYFFKSFVVFWSSVLSLSDALCCEIKPVLLDFRQLTPTCPSRPAASPAQVCPGDSWQSKGGFLLVPFL